jgi:hypothetical protein
MLTLLLILCNLILNAQRIDTVIIYMRVDILYSTF